MGGSGLTSRGWWPLGLFVALAFAVTPVVAQSVEPSASPSTSPTPSLATSAWEAAPTSPIPVDAVTQAVTTTSEIIAMGPSRLTEDVFPQHVLASPDGVTWTERSVFPDVALELRELFADGDTLFVLGQDERFRPAVWRSTNGGASWGIVVDRRPFRPGADGGPTRTPAGNRFEVAVDAMVRGPAGLVVRGSVGFEDTSRTALWRSADGLGWERLRLEGPVSVVMADLAANDQAYLAVSDGRLWRSTDAQRWDLVELDRFADEVVTTVILTDGGFVALGTFEPDDPGPWPYTSVWTAGPDGATWTRQQLDPPLPDGGDMLAREIHVHAVGDDVVVLGETDAGDEAWQSAWRLAPETGWVGETVSPGPDDALADIVTLDDQEVIVGVSVGPDGTPAAAAWRRAPVP